MKDIMTYGWNNFVSVSSGDTRTYENGRSGTDGDTSDRLTSGLFISTMSVSSVLSKRT